MGRDKDRVGFQDLMDRQEGRSGPLSHPVCCLEEVGVELGSGAVSRASEDRAFIDAEGDAYVLRVS